MYYYDISSFISLVDHKLKSDIMINEKWNGNAYDIDLKLNRLSLSPLSYNIIFSIQNTQWLPIPFVPTWSNIQTINRSLLSTRAISRSALAWSRARWISSHQSSQLQRLHSHIPPSYIGMSHYLYFDSVLVSRIRARLRFDRCYLLESKKRHGYDIDSITAPLVIMILLIILIIICLIVFVCLNPLEINLLATFSILRYQH